MGHGERGGVKGRDRVAREEPEKGISHLQNVGSYAYHLKFSTII